MTLQIGKEMNKMHGILPGELEILKLLEDYGSLKEEQVLRYFACEKTGTYLEFLKRKGLITINGNIAALRGVQTSTAIIKAFEVILYYKNDMQEHHPSGPLFTLFFKKGGRFYDVAVIEPGNEAFMSAAINPSSAERVIAVIDSKEQIPAIEIEKLVLFFIPGNPPRLYEKSGNGR